MSPQIVTIFMSKPENTYRTSVSATASLKDVANYFVGQRLHIGQWYDESADAYDFCTGICLEANDLSMHFEGNISKQNLEKQNLVFEYELVTGKEPIAA